MKPAGPIMILAGGTGGHVFPGLAVAEVLRSRDHGVVWLGTRRGLEARLVPAAGIDIEWISISGVRGRGLLAWASAPFRIGVAVAQALATLRRRRPSAVLGLGGFVAAPGGIAAWLSGRPLAIHEQNAVAGSTNRLLARLARRVFEAFPGSFPTGVMAECIGNPVRRSIATLPPPSERMHARADGPAHLLVLGGSQGARALNEVLPAALAALPEETRPDVWHQAGAAYEETRAAYSRQGIAARVEAFIEDMAAAYAWADLAVARAGALTVAELAAAGVGAVLIPFPYATDDHQTRNAQHFVGGGAGVLLPQSELEPRRLARELGRLLGDRQTLAALAERARAQAKLEVAERLADACVELAEGGR